MFKYIISFFAFFFSFFLSSAPAFAQSAPKWEAMAGEFSCGYATRYEAAATTIEAAARLAASNWDACETQYGVGNCAVLAKGFSSGPRGSYCDYDQNADAMNGGLATERAERLFTAFAGLRPSATLPGNREPTLFFFDTAVRKSYIVIRPKSGVGLLPPPPPTACNDGADNDGDGKVDMADPGCETPDDQSEWNAKPIPADPNVRWADLVGVIVAEAATPCPVSITGWWEIDPQDKEYHFHYKVDHGYCPSECRTSDVSATMPGYQMRSPAGTAKAAITLPDPLVTADVKGKLNWTILRTHIEAPERAPGIEYVDATGAVDATMWYGRAANVTDRGDLIIIDFKSVCGDLIMAELEQEYGYLDGVVLGAGSLTASVLGDGSSLTTHPAGTLVAEVGIETGTPKAAFLGTIGLGGYFDDNCNMPAAWLMQLRLGATFNRSETVGMLVDTRVQYSFGPSYVIYPDDPETEENEYSASSALGTNAAAFLVDVGPRFAFGRGVHSGWIAPTLTAGPKLRWFDDSAGMQRVTLTGDFGGTLAVGFDW